MLDKITVYTQSSIHIKTDMNIYFDPFKMQDSPHDADIVFITHAHYDHFSPEDIAAVSHAETVYVIPASMRPQLRALSIAEERLIAMHPGEVTTVQGIVVEAVPAYNLDKPMHPKENGWLGYVVTVEGQRVYVCGDTDAIPEGAAVSCDIVLLPIGGTFTMDAEEAADFVARMQPHTAIPTHYGSIVGNTEDGMRFLRLVEAPVNVCLKLEF